MDAEDSAIVIAITSLAAALNLTAVAEGVETLLQTESLIELGCGRAQGYYLARPASAEVVEDLLSGPASA